MARVITARAGAIPRLARPSRRPMQGTCRFAIAALLPLVGMGFAAAARSGPGLMHDIKAFPGVALPALGRFPSVCGLQCRMGALANGDRGISVGGTLYPWGDRSCGTERDLLRAMSAVPADPDGSAGLVAEERGLAVRVCRLARSLGAARGRAVAADERYLTKETFNGGLCPLAHQALVQETETLSVLGLQRNSLRGTVSRHIGTYDVVGYRHAQSRLQSTNTRGEPA